MWCSGRVLLLYETGGPLHYDFSIHSRTLSSVDGHTPRRRGEHPCASSLNDLNMSIGTLGCQQLLPLLDQQTPKCATNKSWTILGATENDITPQISFPYYLRTKTVDNNCRQHFVNSLFPPNTNQIVGDEEKMAATVEKHSMVSRKLDQSQAWRATVLKHCLLCSEESFRVAREFLEPFGRRRMLKGDHVGFHHELLASRRQ